VFGDLVDQSHLGAQTRADDAVDASHVDGGQIAYGVKAGSGEGGDGNTHASGSRIVQLQL